MEEAGRDSAVSRERTTTLLRGRCATYLPIPSVSLPPPSPQLQRCTTLYIIRPLRCRRLPPLLPLPPYLVPLVDARPFLFCRARRTWTRRNRDAYLRILRTSDIPRQTVPKTPCNSLSLSLLSLTLSAHLFCILSSAQESRALRSSGSPSVFARARMAIDAA